MSDWSELSLEDHELNYILNKFSKRETETNRAKLREIERAYKEHKSKNGSQLTKAYTKDEFYQYLQSNHSDLIKGLEKKSIER